MSMDELLAEMGLMRKGNERLKASPRKEMEDDLRKVMLGGGGWTINPETKVRNPLDLSDLLMASSTKMPKLENLTKEGIKAFKSRYEEYKVLAPSELVRAPQRLLKLEY